MIERFTCFCLLHKQGNVKPSAVAISLIKGFHLQPEGGISLLSNLIKEELEIQTAALMGNYERGENE